MGEATMEQKEALIQLDIEEVKKLVIVNQNASAIGIYGVEVDGLTTGEVRVFVNGHMQTMWPCYVVTYNTTITLVALASTSSNGFVVIDVDGDTWEPRSIAYTYEEEAHPPFGVPSLRHLL